MSAPPPSLSPPVIWWRSLPARVVAISLLVIGTATLLGAVCQTQFGIFGSKNWEFPTNLQAKLRKDRLAYKVPLPQWATGALAEDQAVLLKDGAPIGSRTLRHTTVLERGNGTYRIKQRYLYFSLPKNEDPRSGLSRLSLSAPRPVSDLVWVLGSFSFLLGALGTWKNEQAKTVSGRFVDRLAGVPDAVILLTVLAFSLAVTLSRLPEAMTYSDGWFSIKGMPYSDASAWDQLATSLSRGEGFVGGFSAQRPLYPTMLGLIYSITGPQLMDARILNAVWLALATAGACAIGMLCGSRLSGVAGALSLLLSFDQRSFSYMLLTETSGVVFGVAALLALCVAVERPKWWLIVLAGLLLAFANLASGFGLFILPGYGLVALAAWWYRQGFRKALLQSLLLAGVVAVTWAPWLVRQQIVHGIPNLASSGAVLMYATAAPEHGGRFTESSAGEWHKQNIPDSEGAKYKYYMDKFKEAVKAAPLEYVGAVARGMEHFAAYFTFQGPSRVGSVVMLLALGGAFFMVRHPPWAVLPALLVVVAGCYFLQGVTAFPLWAISCIVLLICAPPEKRYLWALVAVTFPFVALLGGVTGGNFGRRMWTCCSWSVILLLTAAGIWAMRRLTRRLIKWRRPESLAGADGNSCLPGPRANQFAIRFSVVLSCLLVAHAVLGSIVATTLWMVHRDVARVDLPGAIRDEATRRVTAKMGLPAPHHAICVGVMQFGEYTCELKGWEDANHWSRSFAVRPYSRTVAFGMMIDEINSSPMACQMRFPTADLPRGVPLMVLGVENRDPDAAFNHDTVLTEVLGFVPIQREGSTITVNWDQLVWMPPSEEAINILGLKPKS